AVGQLLGEPRRRGPLSLHRAGGPRLEPGQREVASAKLGPQPQVAGQPVFVSVLDAPALDALVAQPGALLAAQVLDEPVAALLRDLQMARLDLRRIDPHRAVALAPYAGGPSDPPDPRPGAALAAA